MDKIKSPLVRMFGKFCSPKCDWIFTCSFGAVNCANFGVCLEEKDGKPVRYIGCIKSYGGTVDTKGESNG